MNHLLWTILAGYFVFIYILLLMAGGRKTLTRVSIVMFIASLVGGFTLYTMGYLPEHASVYEAFQAMLRGVFSTGRMFLVNDDYSYILDRADKQWLVESVWFQGTFWLSHVLALFVSVSAVLSLFGRQLLVALKLRLGFYKSTYIICGADSRALALGKNIALHDGTRSRPDRKRLVVFLDEALPDDTRDAVEQMGGAAFTYQPERFSQALLKAGFGASKARMGKIRLFVMPHEEAKAYELARQALECAQGKGLPAPRLSLYIMSETEWMIEKLGQAVPAAQRYDLSVFSQAELAARKLIEKLPPIHAARIENGRAQGDFTVMILGFGQLGRQAFRRLVMNGQFVGGKMRTVIVDRQLDGCFGQFIARYPGLSAHYEMEKYCMDVRSEDFYSLLGKLKDRLDYVVVALGNDILNLEVTNDLSQYFRRGEGVPVRQIAVGVCDHTYVACDEDGTRTFFSDDQDIFSESIIIREDTDRMAKAVSAVYNKCKTQDEAEKSWYESDYLTRQSNRAVADFLPSMLSLIGYTHSNVPSPGDFRLSAEMTEVLARTEHLRWNAFHYAMGFTPMSMAEMNIRIRKLQAQGLPAEGCRIDQVKRQHVCLVDWEELDALSEAYNSALRQAGRESNRDFKQNDINNVQNIPLFTQAYFGRAGK